MPDVEACYKFMTSVHSIFLCPPILKVILPHLCSALSKPEYESRCYLIAFRS